MTGAPAREGNFDMKRASVIGLVLAVLLALSASGCSDSPWSDPTPPPPPPPPDTPDVLMTRFKAAYGGMKIDDYRTVLASNYQFILRAADVPAGQSDRFTFADELHIAENMFSGNAVQKPDGTTAPGISSITVSVLTRSQPWAYVGASDPDFPLTQHSLYEIQISFARAGFNTIIVTGQQEFFVSWRDTVVNGVTKPFYQLRGQRDLSNGTKATEMSSWGGVKSLYR
jgi:hypothetical protein